MTHLDLHNCSVLDLNVAQNAAMQYFDCDNNHIRELNFANATGIETIHANDNFLFQIAMGPSHNSLADMQFKNNHINAIDLSGCDPNVLTNLEDQNNGRSIVANMSYVGGEKMYYFQLLDVEDGGYFLSASECSEDVDPNYGRNTTATLSARSLAGDGFVTDNVTWGEQPVTGRRNTRAENYDLDPDKVIGSIVVLENTSTDPAQGSGTETYTYNNGLGNNGTSTFYLNWTADGSIVTALNDINTSTQALEGGDGNITISLTADTKVTVYDLSGRIVTEQFLDAGTHTINGLQSGVYIIAGNKVVVK